MAKLNGIPVNFGFQGATDANQDTGLSIAVGGTGFVVLSGILLQQVDVSKKAEMELVRSSLGEEAMHGWYGQVSRATLEYVVSGSSLATTLTNSTLPNPGDFVNITTCASVPDLVGSAWEIMSEPKISGSNTTSKKITLQLQLSPNITARAT